MKPMSYHGPGKRNAEECGETDDARAIVPIDSVTNSGTEFDTRKGDATK